MATLLSESRLQTLFLSQHRLVDHFFNQIDESAVEQLMEVLVSCQGTIFWTGVGKSGMIAKTIAATLVSTGSPALYLSPTDALHGDLGIATERDVCVLMSRSGESDELVTVLPYLKAKGAFLIALVCKRGSRLEKGCDLTIELPMEKELCPFNLAPVTSTVLQLAFGNVIATALMESKQVSLDEYAANHPAGSIGKQITLKVKDLMLIGDELPTCAKTDTLFDVLMEFSEKKCGCIMIVNEKMELEGIFTDGDLRRTLQARGADLLSVRIGEVMTCSAKSTSADHLAIDAMREMERGKPVTVLPVLEENRLVGLVRMHDIVQSGI